MKNTLVALLLTFSISSTGFANDLEGAVTVLGSQLISSQLSAKVIEHLMATGQVKAVWELAHYRLVEARRERTSRINAIFPFDTVLIGAQVTAFMNDGRICQSEVTFKFDVRNEPKNISMNIANATFDLTHNKFRLKAFRESQRWACELNHVVVDGQDLNTLFGSNISFDNWK